MARTKRSAKLDTRTARLALPVQERHVDTIQPGRYIIYERPKNGAAGSWMARWFNLETKKQKQTKLGAADDFTDADGIGTLTYAQAQAMARDWFQEQDHRARLEAGGEVVDLGPFTVDAALDLYFTDAERRGMKGLSQDRHRAKKWIRPELGALEVADLTRTRIETWLGMIASSPRGVRGKAAMKGDQHVPVPRKFKNPRPEKPAPEPRKGPQTDEEKRARKDSANRVLTVLKAALNHALDRQRVRHGEAWQTVKPFKGVSASRVRFLTDGEQALLVNACPPDFRRLIQGALLTGARYGELTRLQVKDFNPEARTIFLEITKGGKSRYTYLTEEGMTFFEALALGRKGDELVFQRDQVKRRVRLDAGNAWANSDQNRFMRAACDASGVDPLTFHELRHTYASMLLNHGRPMHVVAAQIGDSIRMVEKHYGHLAASALAETIKSMPGLGIVEESNIKPLKIAGRSKG